MTQAYKSGPTKTVFCHINVNYCLDPIIGIINLAGNKLFFGPPWISTVYEYTEYVKAQIGK